MLYTLVHNLSCARRGDSPSKTCSRRPRRTKKSSNARSGCVPHDSSQGGRNRCTSFRRTPHSTRIPSLSWQCMFGMSHRRIQLVRCTTRARPRPRARSLRTNNHRIPHNVSSRYMHEVHYHSRYKSIRITRICYCSPCIQSIPAFRHTRRMPPSRNFRTVPPHPPRRTRKPRRTCRSGNQRVPRTIRRTFQNTKRTSRCHSFV